MATYVLFEVDWQDQEKAQEYRQRFGPVLEKYGGKTLCAGSPKLWKGSGTRRGWSSWNLRTRKHFERGIRRPSMVR